MTNLYIFLFIVLLVMWKVVSVLTEKDEQIELVPVKTRKKRMSDVEKIVPVKDEVSEVLRANVISINDISKRMARIARLRDILDVLKKDTQDMLPTAFPLWVMAKGTFGETNGRVWIRADVCIEAHELALRYTTNNKVWGVDECGLGFATVPYKVYIVENNVIHFAMKNLLGHPGEKIAGMGNTDAAFLKMTQDKYRIQDYGGL